MAAIELFALRSLLSSYALCYAPSSSLSDQTQNADDLLNMVRAVVQCILSDTLPNANMKKHQFQISTSVYAAITMRKLEMKISASVPFKSIITFSC